MSADEQTELLREMRDLLLVIAEPALAKRDEKLRASLVAVAGNSKLKRAAVLLMDGTRAQATIRSVSGMDHANLSRLVKALREAKLLAAEDKPKLVLSIPLNFFENSDKDDE